MFQKQILSFMIVLICGSIVRGQDRRIDMGFQGQISGAVAELKEKMEADPQIKGRKLRLGRFTGPNLPDSSFGQEFEHRFRETMGDVFAEESGLVVNGVFRILPGKLSENKSLHVIQVVITIEFQFRKLQTVTREINRSADVAKITGTTVALPDVDDVEIRNKVAFTNLLKPTFGIRDRHFVTAVGHEAHAVAILKRVGGRGKPIPVVPHRINGLAFVELGVNDTFSIVLRNYDVSCDASADVSIDGLDVANTFSVDGVKYKGYSVNRSRGSKPGSHTIPGWLKSAKVRTGNVFEFVVNELGKGAATEMKSRHNLGVIHVAFFESVPIGEQLPSRKFGEVGKGKPLDVDYSVTSVTRRESPISQISIRYSNPARK